MQTDEVLDLIKQVAEEVINPRFRALAEDEVVEKRPGDLVTIADQESEAILTRELLARVPGSIVVGEEACFADPSILDALSAAPHAFLVDPVDGTRNFAQGRDEHAVMVAEVKFGVTTRSWIWQPRLGHSFVAELGAGAWRDGERMPERGPVERIPVGGTSRDSLIQQDTSGRLHLGRSNWCCGVDYPQVAMGELDFLLYVTNRPWDHAPGELLLAETGGTVVHWTGLPYRPATKEVGLIAAARPELAPVVRQALDLRADAWPKED